MHTTDFADNAEERLITQCVCRARALGYDVTRSDALTLDYSEDTVTFRYDGESVSVRLVVRYGSIEVCGRNRYRTKWRIRHSETRETLWEGWSKPKAARVKRALDRSPAGLDVEALRAIARTA